MYERYALRRLPEKRFPPSISTTTNCLANSNPEATEVNLTKDYHTSILTKTF